MRGYSCLVLLIHSCHCHKDSGRPQALSVLNQVLPTDVAQRLKQLKPFECLFEDDLVVARTGYTGEKGAEVMLQKDQLCQRH